jgi:hypothetical protein
VPQRIFRTDTAIFEHIDGEPRRERAGWWKLFVAVQLRQPVLLLTFLVSALLWPWLLVGSLVWGRPPNVVHAWQVRRYLQFIWTEQPPAPGLRVLERVWMTQNVVQRVLVAPIWGGAWLLDEALYGRALDNTAIIAPLIEISAGRSGSTQLARYLCRDPRLLAPSLLQFTFPFLWLWKLVPRTLGRFVTPDQVRARLEAAMRPEFLQRHEGDPFETDTFEGCFYAPHLYRLAPFLGPRVMREDFAFADPAAHSQRHWDSDFVDLFDRIGRKTLLHAGPLAKGRARRLFIKGHFLAAGPALAKRFPDARFLTMVRHPAKRMQSAVNYMRANPLDLLLDPAPWAWWAEGIAKTEPAYCKREMDWFTRQDGVRRCVVRFDDYVRDLEGVMGTVYRECFDEGELPESAPRSHRPRNRKDYLLNRSLEQVGIDQEALEAELVEYIEWCKGATA